MSDFTPEKIKLYFEQAAKANADAWNAQTSYFDGLVKRNTRCFSSLAEARMSSFKEMSEAKTFNQAFESNQAFENQVRDKLQHLQDDSVKTWEALQGKLKSIYTPASERANKAAPKKTAPKKAALKKVAPKKAVFKKAAPKKAAVKAVVEKAVTTDKAA